MMYSLGLYPLIDKPTRITDFSATLIDNIFTNELHHNITSGILFNDISDHLPIFAHCEFNVTRRIVNGFQRGYVCFTFKCIGPAILGKCVIQMTLIKLMILSYTHSQLYLKSIVKLK